jgi:hypothetical protein
VKEDSAGAGAAEPRSPFRSAAVKTGIRDMAGITADITGLTKGAIMIGTIGMMISADLQAAVSPRAFVADEAD